MKAGWIVAAVVLLTTGAIWLLTGREDSVQSWTLVETVCADCHNEVDLAGDLSLAGLGPESIADHPEIFEAVTEKLRGRLMPPPGTPEPPRAQIDALITRIEAALDADPAPGVGHVRAQRLTRNEYASAIEGLLGVQLEPAEFLPTEIEVEGFANIASALSVSPAFIEQSFGLVRTSAHLAVGEPAPKLAASFIAPPPAGSQQSYIDGFPLGTRGGVRFEHVFPADGEYRLTLKDLGVGLYPSAQQSEHTVIVLVDGEERLRRTIGGPEDLALADRGGAPGRAEIMARFTDMPLEITAGRHDIIITFIERSRGISDEQIGGGGRGFSYNGAPRMPGISGGIDLIGPYESTGVARNLSRNLLFVCEPEVAERERECAERITARFAERAFRRPVTAADIERLMPFYELGRQGPGGFDEGMELVVAAVLASPDMLYRTTAPPEDPDAHIYPLDDYELATRLSFFLWSQGPDDNLLALARDGRLSDPAVLDGEVTRMLADRRAEALVSQFALPWLDLDDLSAVEPDPAIFGEWNAALREDFAAEIEQFVASILLQPVDVRELLAASHSYLNERLARHYGIDGIYGPQMRRVELDDPRRFGLLGKGAVQLRTSYGDRTSPVLRGAWVLEKLLGTPPTPPPPGVETNLATPPGEEAKTIRARLEQHRAAPNCNACHGAIDPYGLALENFNVTGRWRDVDREAQAPIDATTRLPGGLPIDGPVALREALLESPDQFVQALTKKLLMYAVGREIEYYDMPAVRSIVRAAAREDYHFSAIVAGVVASDAFRMQAVADGGE